MCSLPPAHSERAQVGRAAGSCCRNTIAAGRNVNEFLQVNHSVPSYHVASPALNPVERGLEGITGPVAGQFAKSPPGIPFDILSRTSTLLI